MVLKLLFPVYVCEYDKQDAENELDAVQAAVYCKPIMQEIRKNYQYFIFDIARKGWLTNREVPAPLDVKVNSVFPAVGVYQNELWGVLNCDIDKELSNDEIAVLEELLMSEFEEGYGEIQSLSCIELDKGRHISVHLMPDFYEDEKRKFLSRKKASVLLQGVDLEADYKEQEIENPIKSINPKGNFTGEEVDHILHWMGQLMVNADTHGVTEGLAQVSEKLYVCMNYIEALEVLCGCKRELERLEKGNSEKEQGVMQRR